jgi:lipid II isoglutaminyl synthase (glutamine-hydrolysing)
MAAVAAVEQTRRPALPVGPSLVPVGLAVQLGRWAGWSSRRVGAGGGGTVSGRVARRLRPDLLARLTAGRTVVLISGTNGKTTTTALLTSALRTAGPVATNAGGDNLLDGLVAALLHVDPAAVIALEVDEAVLPEAMAQTRPQAVVLLNLSRDQLDRCAEVGRHVTRWQAALREHPQAVVVADADDPLVVSAVLAARPAAGRVVWVGTGSTWRGDAQVCPRCSAPLPPAPDYRCSSCSFARPDPAWTLDHGGLTGPDGTVHTVRLALPGRVNRGNAALAVAAAGALGVPAPHALDAVARIDAVGGRYRRLRVGTHDVQLLLAKNPAGWAEALRMAARPGAALVIAINARGADGTDPSWLCDVPFEQLQGRHVIATGERRHDVRVRLTYADVEHRSAPDVVAAIELAPAGECVVVANYTAFQQAQRLLRTALPA